MECHLAGPAPESCSSLRADRGDAIAPLAAVVVDSCLVRLVEYCTALAITDVVFSRRERILRLPRLLRPGET